MPTVAELKAKREAAGQTLISLRNETKAEGFVESAEFDSRWEKANAEYDSALLAEENEIKIEERRKVREDVSGKIERDASRIGALARSKLRVDYDPRGDTRSQGGVAAPTRQDWGVALKCWATSRSEDYDPTDEERDTLKRCRVNVMSDSMRLPTGKSHMDMVCEMQEVFIDMAPAMRTRAIRQVLASWNTETPESAAYVAEPPQILRQLEVNKLAWGGLLQVATIMNTTTGEDILLPFTDDTGVKGRRIAEDGPLGTEKSPKFGLIRWAAHKYTSDIIAVTYEMLRDAFINLEEHIGNVGGERLGRVENYECTRGTGNSMPRGIVYAAPVGVTTASAGAIVYEDVIDLEESIDEAYQNGERVGFMMHKAIRVVLRKLKDLNGQPLLRLGQETGNRDQLNGKPIYINMDMDSALTAGKDVMLYGDYAKYRIRRVGGTRIVRDPYTQRISNDRDLFAAVEYLDGNLVNAGTAPVKKMRMHA